MFYSMLHKRGCARILTHPRECVVLPCFLTLKPKGCKGNLVAPNRAFYMDTSKKLSITEPLAESCMSSLDSANGHDYFDKTKSTRAVTSATLMLPLPSTSAAMVLNGEIVGSRM